MGPPKWNFGALPCRGEGEEGGTKRSLLERVTLYMSYYKCDRIDVGLRFLIKSRVDDGDMLVR